MKLRRTAVLAGSGILSIAIGAAAHGQQAGAGVEQSGGSDSLAEVIVTARRKNEVLQDVPQVVNAVTPADLQKLNLLTMQDLSGVVPGLEIVDGGGGFNDYDTLRGVTFNPSTGTQNSIGFYFNDVPITNNFVTQSNFDVGQIEVLRGPQGTLRGEPSPSGSLTLTTKRPDLEQFGGYATVTATNYGNTNENGALNLPLITDKLAVRLAGIADLNHYNDVRSIDTTQDPYFHNYGGRASVRYEPVDSVEVNFTYQHTDWHQSSYQQLFGPGAPGGVNPEAPANFNGPAISPTARLSAQSYPDGLSDAQNIGTGQIDWHVAGQVVTYDGSWWSYALRHTTGPTIDGNQYPAVNAANPIPWIDIPYTTQRSQSHELRISSETPFFGFLDYTAGAFYRDTLNQVDAVQGTTFLSGSFGSPFAVPSPFIYDPAYTLQALVNSPSKEKELSEFIHLTFHLPYNTEFTAGGRYINYTKAGYTEVNLQTADASIAVPLPVPCAAAGLSSTYPGTCNLPASVAIPNSTALPFTPQNLRDHPVIYNVSLSTKVTPDLLVYLSSGSSWRPPAQSVGIYNASNDPTLNSLLHLQTEKSYEYEGGFKWSFLEHRGRLDMTYYHQKFEGFIYEGLPTIYLQNNGQTTSVQPFSFNSNPDAVVNGIDLDSGFQITRQWSVDASATWANGHLTGSDIPCHPPSGGTTAAAFPAGTYIFLCPSHASTSTAPNWNASARSEYDQPLPIMNGSTDAFVRGLFVYYGRNPHASEFYVTPGYGIFNLYAGLRNAKGDWEVAAFAKNLFDIQRALNEGYPAVTTSSLATTFGSTGYYPINSMTPLREFGLTLTYSFGSH
jgi:iron complex outermembrane recepter protein